MATTDTARFAAVAILARRLQETREKWWRNVRTVLATIQQQDTGKADPWAADLAAIAYQLVVVKRILARYSLLTEEEQVEFIHDLYRTLAPDSPFLSLAFLRYTAAEQAGGQSCRDSFAKELQALLLQELEDLEAYWFLLIEAELLASETAIDAATALKASQPAALETQALQDRLEQLRSAFAN